MNPTRPLKLAELNFTNRLKNACPHVFVRVACTPLLNPVLLHLNNDLLDRLNIDPYEKEKSSFLRFINGDLDFDGLFFGASVYSGHQFGYYVPRLGDGRAITLAEIKNNNDEYFELQLKGSGLTPYSRMGDGKAVVRSSIREYLGSAHLKALSIPTTEALTIIHGSDDVYRESVEKSAIVFRVAESFLRFGHFQYFFHTDQKEELKSLIDFTIATYFKNYTDHPNSYLLFFQDVVKKTAKLFAGWQSVGFCHGVLNTDNTSILGLTIDYGPFGFIDHFDLNHICNHSDHEGRYSFGNQPEIGMWNLEQLCIALQDYIPEADLKRTLDTYPQIFHVEYRRLLKNKLGLEKIIDGDEEFLRKLLGMLVATKIDYTQFFRALSHYQLTQSMPFLKSLELSEFLKIYDERIKFELTSKEDRASRMLAVNPKFVLRNYLAQMAIETYLTDPKVLENLFLVLTHPFDEWEQFEEWSAPASTQYKNLSVSCSS